MKIPDTFNGMVLVGHDGKRGTDNFYAQYPYCVTWAKRHIFYVWYCGNPDCLRRIYTTWDYCPHCGQKITWPTFVRRSNKRKKGSARKAEREREWELDC